MELSEHWEKILGGVVALPYILYKVYQTLKTDSKGANLDDRIKVYSEKLEASLDKTYAKLDALQKENNLLWLENSSLKARITIAEDENMRVRQMFTKAVEGPKPINGEIVK